jgi:TRAP-type C4-dicarboxylate transport system permease small subunit
MRKLLDGIYNSAAALAALFMLGLLVMVLLSIVSRQLHFYVPGVDAYAGYLMAASSFLAMAHTLKRGEHIRVTLLLNALRGRWKKGMELFALGLAIFLAMLFAFYSCKLAWQSHVFNDMSTGSDATPLWLPQIAMAYGSVIFAFAFIDEALLEIQGRRVAHHSDEALRNE